MKWIILLLLFIGGLYYLVNWHKTGLRDQEQAELLKKEQIRTAEDPLLPMHPEREYMIRFSANTLQTLRTLTQDPNEKVRYAAVELLWQLQDEQVPATIKRMFADETESWVKKNMITMLARDKSKLSLSLISAAINCYDKETRVEAVKAIGTFGNKEAIAALVPAMKDYDDDIRLKAVEAANAIRRDIQANKEQKLREVDMKPVFRVE